tara:strand:- start:177 stop:305 length:129 start_codon:yes stop_codon:yes gene_type:complete
MRLNLLNKNLYKDVLTIEVVEVVEVVEEEINSKNKKLNFKKI